MSRKGSVLTILICSTGVCESATYTGRGANLVFIVPGRHILISQCRLQNVPPLTSKWPCGSQRQGKPIDCPIPLRLWLRPAISVSLTALLRYLRCPQVYSVFRFVVGRTPGCVMERMAGFVSDTSAPIFLVYSRGHNHHAEATETELASHFQDRIHSFVVRYHTNIKLQATYIASL